MSSSCSAADGNDTVLSGTDTTTAVEIALATVVAVSPRPNVASDCVWPEEHADTDTDTDIAIATASTTTNNR
jgi:hypothetical protein